MFITPKKRVAASAPDCDENDEQMLEYSGEILQVLSPTLKSYHSSAKKPRNSLGDAARIFSPSKSFSSSKMDVDGENSKENAVNLSLTSNYKALKANERSTPFSPRASNDRSMTPSKRAVTPGRRPMTPSKPSTPFHATPTPTKQPIVLTSTKKTAKSSTPMKSFTSTPSSKLVNLELPEKAHKRDWDMRQFDGAVGVGKGKFGLVYHAKRYGKGVAVKVISKSFLTDEQSLKMLQREVDIQYDLKHEHIVQMHGFFHDMRYVYLVLDYAAGGEFYRYLRTLPSPVLEEGVVKTYIRQIASALAHMHTHHIVHRDLKPENIFIQTAVSDGLPHKLVLGDFGSAVNVAEGLRFTICGTPEYLAPEVIVSAGHDCAVDAWGLGILIYELLVGSTPFAGPKLSSHPPPTDEQQHLHRRAMYERIVTHLDELSFPPAVQASEQAKRVMDGLVRVDRRERMKVVEVLEGEWLSAN